MPLSYEEQDVLANSHPFRTRVQMAVVRQALAVTREDTGTVGHAIRAALAGNILRNPGQYSQMFAFAAAGESGISADSSDADLDTTVAAVWNVLAGV